MAMSPGHDSVDPRVQNLQRLGLDDYGYADDYQQATKLDKMNTMLSLASDTERERYSYLRNSIKNVRGLGSRFSAETELSLDVKHINNAVNYRGGYTEVPVTGLMHPVGLMLHRTLEDTERIEEISKLQVRNFAFGNLEIVIDRSPIEKQTGGGKLVLEAAFRTNHMTDPNIYVRAYENFKVIRFAGRVGPPTLSKVLNTRSVVSPLEDNQFTLPLVQDDEVMSYLETGHQGIAMSSILHLVHQAVYNINDIIFYDQPGIIFFIRMKDVEINDLKAIASGGRMCVTMSEPLPMPNDGQMISCDVQFQNLLGHTALTGTFEYAMYEDTEGSAFKHFMQQARDYEQRRGNGET